MFEALQNSLFSLIYPQQCSVCAGSVESLADGVACDSCWAETRLFDGSEMLCSKCGAYSGDRSAFASVRCHKCDDHFYDKAVALGVYEKALAASVIRLKTMPSLPKRLTASIKASKQLEVCSEMDLIIPVPLSRRRRLERGFNQAEIIADAVSRVLRIPVDKQSLSRKLHSPIHRVAMDQKARELSVRNAFEVTRPKLMAAKSVLLVDDVLTSGATASYAAKILKKSGAEKVVIFTLARSVMN